MGVAKTRMMTRDEMQAFRDKLAKQSVDHEVARRNIRAAANIMVGHAVEKALATPEARQVMDEMFDPRPSLARSRQALRAWDQVIRDILDTLKEWEPQAEPDPTRPEA